MERSSNRLTRKTVDLSKPPARDPGARLRFGRDDDRVPPVHGLVSPDSPRPLPRPRFMGLFPRKRKVSPQRHRDTEEPTKAGLCAMRAKRPSWFFLCALCASVVNIPLWLVWRSGQAPSVSPVHGVVSPDSEKPPMPRRFMGLNARKKRRCPIETPLYLSSVIWHLSSGIWLSPPPRPAPPPPPGPGRTRRAGRAPPGRRR